MSDPIVHIKTDGIANSDYPIKEIPFNVTKATIHLDYSSRAPVKPMSVKIDPVAVPTGVVKFSPPAAVPL